MNYQTASSILTLFNELRQEVETRLPQEIDEGKKFYDGKPITYHLSKIDFYDMEVTYSRYVGCGDYEERTRPIDLNDLFD